MRAIFVTSVAMLVAAAGATSAAPGAGVKDSIRPTLRLVATAPPTIAGAHFRPGELVRVVVRSTQTTQRRVRATRTGTFRIVMEAWMLDRCGTLVVIQARSVSGSVSLAWKRPQPACPPPLGGLP